MNGQEIIDGDLQVTGRIDAIGGIDSAALTTLATQTEQARVNSQKATAYIDEHIRDIAADNRVTPEEKAALLQWWKGTQTEYPIVRAQAVAKPILQGLIDAYAQAYADLEVYLIGQYGVLNNLAITSTTTPGWYEATVGWYIRNRTDVLAAIDGKNVTQTFRTLYMRSATAPARPAGPNPIGWTDNIPSEPADLPIWQTGAQIDSAGQIIGEWYIPVRFTGAATVVAVLSNEVHHVPADMNGDNCNFNGAESYMRVYEGSQETTNQFQMGYTPGPGVTVDAAYFTATRIVRITGLANDEGHVDLTGMRQGVEVKKRFGLTKAKQGDPAPVYQLQSSTPVVYVNSQGAMRPGVTIESSYRAGLAAPQPYAGLFRFYVNDVLQFTTPNPQSSYQWAGFSGIILTETDIIITDNPADEILLPFEYQYQPGKDIQSMRVELWNAENSVKLDSLTMVLMADFGNYVPEVTAGAPRYLGRFPNDTQPPTYFPGQAWLLYGHTDSKFQRGVWTWTGAEFRRLNGDGTDPLNHYFAQALPDILWAVQNGYGFSSDYGSVTYIENLVAGIIATNKLMVGTKNLDQTVIDGGFIKTNLIKASELQVGAAQITGRLKALQIEVENLEVEAAKIKGSLHVSKIVGLGALALKSVVDNADVTSIDGGKITTGSIRSSNYDPGKLGWNISKEGNAEFNTAIFRGEVGSGATSRASIVRGQGTEPIITFSAVMAHGAPYWSRYFTLRYPCHLLWRYPGWGVDGRKGILKVLMGPIVDQKDSCDTFAAVSNAHFLPPGQYIIEASYIQIYSVFGTDVVSDILY